MPASKYQSLGFSKGYFRSFSSNSVVRMSKDVATIIIIIMHFIDLTEASGLGFDILGVRRMNQIERF